MPRVLALTCSDCRRRFGGDSTLRRHRVISGDRYRCQPDDVLTQRGWSRDSEGVWHRPATDQLSLLEASGKVASEQAAPVVKPTEARRLSRSTDPTTSARAAAAIAPRTGSLKAALLRVYAEATDGLTDEEAALRAGLTLYQATKRCADLRNDGFLEVVGERRGSSGQARRVCRVAQAVSA